MPHAMYLRLTEDEADALHRLAERERRTMRDQAALVLAQELRRRGLLGQAGRPRLRPVLRQEGDSWMEGYDDGPDGA